MTYSCCYSAEPHLIHPLGPALGFPPLHQRNDGRTLSLGVAGVGVRQSDETLRVLGKVPEVSLLNTPGVKTDFPSAVECHHLVRFVVQMANVKGLKDNFEFFLIIRNFSHKRFHENRTLKYFKKSP